MGYKAATMQGFKYLPVFTMSVEVELNPHLEASYSFDQLVRFCRLIIIYWPDVKLPSRFIQYMKDVARLKLSDSRSGPNRAAFFWQNGTVFAASQPQPINCQQGERDGVSIEPWHTSGTQLSVKAVAAGGPTRSYLEDTPLSVNEISNSLFSELVISINSE
jgi:hypothetical protein